MSGIQQVFVTLLLMLHTMYIHVADPYSALVRDIFPYHFFFSSAQAPKFFSAPTANLRMKIII